MWIPTPYGRYTMSTIGWLFLAVIFSSGVAMTMKTATVKTLALWPFLAVNYLVCNLWLLACGGWRVFLPPSAEVAGLGIFVGVMYVLCLLLFKRSIAAIGLALSTTLMRLSAALPTMGSLLIFAEPINAWQIVGIGLAFACLPLASHTPLHVGRAKQVAGGSMIWGILLLIAYGLTDFAFKVQAELIPSAEPRAFMAVIFGTALLITFPCLFRQNRFDQPCVVWGAVLGTTNMLATFCWIRTLAHLPGSVAYPSLGLGVIVLATMASLLIWHERLRPANYAFLVLAGVAVLLINV